MTTDDHSPRTFDRSADVDGYASDVVDGLIEWSDIPRSLHDLVADRADRFSVLRASLLNTASHMRVDDSRREAAISNALDRSAATSSRRHTASRSSRAVFALAASIVAIMGISFAVLQRTGSTDDAFVSDLSDSSAAEFSVNALSESVPGRSSSSDRESVSAEAIDGAMKNVPEYATIDDIARAVEELFDAGGTIAHDGEVLPPQDPSGVVAETYSVCIDETAKPVRIDVALLDGRHVQIRVFADGGFSIVDSVTCTLIASRVDSSR